jgi:mono/diheme cytochrome c family protein
MRRARAIVALFLLPWSCGGEASGRGDSNAGAALYASQGCGTCHGSEGAGTAFGPTLHGKKAFWTREKLALYLRDPAGYEAKDPRLLEQAQKYSLPMQRYDKLTEEELRQLADHVMSLP